MILYLSQITLENELVLSEDAFMDAMNLADAVLGIPYR